jgi:hypothetical protein
MLQFIKTHFKVSYRFSVHFQFYFPVFIGFFEKKLSFFIFETQFLA